MESEEELELENFAMDTSPDAPLTAPTTTQPKWLAPQRPRWQRRIITSLRNLLRPRLTWRYILCAIVFSYAFICFLRGVPLLVSPLPEYTGEHEVGAVDLEIPLETPQRVSDTTLKGSKELAFEVETVLFTVYYPTSKGVKAKKPKHYWIPKPVGLAAEGYATLGHINNFILRPVITFVLWGLAGGVTIPAKVDVPLLSLPDASSDDNTLFPVMVFSHGMASSRTDYTMYLGELASRGHVVAAIEHRDGSSPGSLVTTTDPKHKDRKVLPLREGDLVSDPPMDSPMLKREQLAFRDIEIKETIRVLRAINEGHGADIFKANSRSEGEHLAAWKDRLNLDSITISGHSYGATGALQALKDAPSTANPAIGGIILDPGKSSGQLNTDVNVPILVVHSNSWSRTHSLFYGRPHFDTVRDLVGGVLKRTGAAWFLTSIGTSHPSVTDAPLIAPLLLSWTTGANIDVKEGLKEYVRVSMDFLNYLDNGTMSGMLNETVTHEVYGEWVSEERKKSFPKKFAKYWEVHVTPVNDEDDGKE